MNENNDSSDVEVHIHTHTQAGPDSSKKKPNKRETKKINNKQTRRSDLE